MGHAPWFRSIPHGSPCRPGHGCYGSWRGGLGSGYSSVPMIWFELQTLRGGLDTEPFPSLGTTAQSAIASVQRAVGVVPTGPLPAETLHAARSRSPMAARMPASLSVVQSSQVQELAPHLGHWPFQWRRPLASAQISCRHTEHSMCAKEVIAQPPDFLWAGRAGSPRRFYHDPSVACPRTVLDRRP